MSRMLCTMLVAAVATAGCGLKGPLYPPPAEEAGPEPLVAPGAGDPEAARGGTDADEEE